MVQRAGALLGLLLTIVPAVAADLEEPDEDPQAQLKALLAGFGACPEPDEDTLDLSAATAIEDLPPILQRILDLTPNATVQYDRCLVDALVSGTDCDVVADPIDCVRGILCLREHAGLEGYQPVWQDVNRRAVGLGLIKVVQKPDSWYIGYVNVGVSLSGGTGCP